MKRRILILGIGSAQRDLLEICHARGHEIFSCSNTETGTARSLAGHFARIDIGDVDAVEAFARQERIDLVYSIGSDLAMPTVCRVSERLGLPALVSSETALACNNKDFLRARLGPEFSGNLDFRVASRIEELEGLRFPAVLKPTDAQGQRGVRKVESMADLRECWAGTLAYSRSGKVIAESYVEGPEVSVNTYSVDGRVVFHLLSDRICWEEYPGGLIREHRVPSRHASPRTAARIEDLVIRVLSALDIRNGPAYFQIKLADGVPLLIEATPRLDGCHLWRLIRYACGVDLLECLMRHLEGDIPQEWPPGEPLPAHGLRLEFLCEAPGRRMDRSRYPTGTPLYEEWYYEDGEVVRPVNGLFEKCGYLIAPGNPPASS